MVGVNSTESMMNMNHEMIFGSFNDYKIQILFQSWDITEPWQFALSCIAVAIFSACFQLLDCWIISLDHAMLSNIKSVQHQSSYVTSNIRPIGWSCVNIFHGIFSTLKFGLSLMLMLIAMLFNPWLFVSLIIGHFVGNYFACDFRINKRLKIMTPKQLTQHKDSTPTYDIAIISRVIRYILCLPQEIHDQDDNQRPVESFRGGAF